MPSYQRAYSWGEEHLKDFIHDLAEHPPGKPYYLGHFLFEKSQQGRLVIDGQQRLTTIILFFSALQAHLQCDSDFLEEGNALQERYLAGSPPPFQTVQSDQRILEQLRKNEVPAGSETKSGRKLIAAWTFFKKQIAWAGTKEALTWARIITQANVTEFVVKDKVQATQIFTLQNNRGKKLSPLELLKSYLMYQTFLHSEKGEEDYKIERIEENFKDIYQTSERLTLLNEDDVLRYHLAAFSPYRHEGAVSSLTRELSQLPQPGDKLARIQQFAEELRQSFVDAENLGKQLKKEPLLADPVILSPATGWPLLLVLQKHFGQTLLSNEHSRSILHHCALNLFKNAFRHGKSRKLDDLVTKLNEYHHDPNRDVAALASHFQWCSQNGTRGYHDFNEAVLHYYQADWHYDSETRFLLWKFENSTRDPKDVTLLPEDYINELNTRSKSNSIEHITPQNPSWTSYSEEFQKECLNNVGNMLLLTSDWNASLGNKPPQEKALRFQGSTHAQHKRVAEMIQSPCEIPDCEEPWCAHKIKKRQQQFLSFITSYLELPALGSDLS